MAIVKNKMGGVIKVAKSNQAPQSDDAVVLLDEAIALYKKAGEIIKQRVDQDLEINNEVARKLRQLVRVAGETAIQFLPYLLHARRQTVVPLDGGYYLTADGIVAESVNGSTKPLFIDQEAIYGRFSPLDFIPGMILTTMRGLQDILDALIKLQLQSLEEIKSVSRQRAEQTREIINTQKTFLSEINPDG